MLCSFELRHWHITPCALVASGTPRRLGRLVSPGVRVYDWWRLRSRNGRGCPISTPQPFRRAATGGLSSRAANCGWGLLGLDLSRSLPCNSNGTPPKRKGTGLGPRRRRCVFLLRRGGPIGRRDCPRRRRGLRWRCLRPRRTFPEILSVAGSSPEWAPSDAGTPSSEAGDSSVTERVPGRRKGVFVNGGGAFFGAGCFGGDCLGGAAEELRAFATTPAANGASPPGRNSVSCLLRYSCGAHCAAATQCSSSSGSP